MNTVCVLMSTYNGEAYLREQLDSILRQTGVELSLLIRDDGSSDATLSILEEYAGNHDNLAFYRGENMGPAGSFLDLLFHCPPADYYALSDQDDVWDADKLSCAVELLAKADPGKPAMYYSNLRIVGPDLRFYRLSHSSGRVYENKYSCLTEFVATGCTIVINRRAQEYLTRKKPGKISMHDTWIYIVCKMFGETVYDPSAHIAYRQHGNNVVGTYLSEKTLRLYSKRIRSLFSRQLQPRYHNAVSFLECYGDLLSPEDREKVEKLSEYKRSLSRKLRLLSDRTLSPRGKMDRVLYRALILLERV